MCCSTKSRSLTVTVHCHVIGTKALELYLHSPIRLHDVTCALLVVSKKKGERLLAVMRLKIQDAKLC